MEHQEFEIEEVDVEEYCKRGERVPHARRYIIRVDKQRVISLKGRVTGAEILALVGKTPGTFKLYQHKQEEIGVKRRLVSGDWCQRPGVGHLFETKDMGDRIGRMEPRDGSEQEGNSVSTAGV